MNSVSIFCHHKHDKYTVDTVRDSDGDIRIDLEQRSDGCFCSERANVYLRPDLALILRDQLSALLDKPAKGVDPENDAASSQNTVAEAK